ncbi:ATP-dependent DNA helicase MER3 [Homalodisca vitripennis]|nr:ATP-dependent DNA helicase MER3 [Homalodisca vitripennis]
MAVEDRASIAELFRCGTLPVLIATSTLAMGVNLPAHLVIIKSTQYYMGGVMQEYPEGQILQMMGRAGRPQFDTTATAVIMTKNSTKTKYEKMVGGKELVESCLHKYLADHLNAEILLGTISDVAVAMDWIRSTFLYIRASKNPIHYSISPALSKDAFEAKLQGLEEENFSFDRYTFSLKLQDSTDCFSLCSEPGRNVSPSLDQLIDRSN